MRSTLLDPSFNKESLDLRPTKLSQFQIQTSFDVDPRHARHQAEDRVSFLYSLQVLTLDNGTLSILLSIYFVFCLSLLYMYSFASSLDFCFQKD